MNELNFLSAVEMAEQVRARTVSPVELVDAHLARIAELNARRDPQLNAFVHVDVERARERAKIAEAAVGPGARSRADALGALHGVPISVKSSVDVAGWPCECGSRLRRGYVPAEDATLGTRLRAAGAILLGNTNVPEFLMAYETDNALYGRTNSPWDLERTPGGSSGGEAAAIAAGCSAGGVGSDGGGSIRVPAHFSGICGLKPTPGRIPATGHFPTSVGPFALLGVVGPMARTVADLKVLFEVTQGPGAGDPSALPVPVRWPVRGDLKKLRIGYFEDDGRTPVTAETRSAVRAAAEALKRAGFVVEPFRPEGLEQARQLWWQFFGIAGGMLLRPMTQGRESDLSPILKQHLSRVAAEPFHTAQTLLDTWIKRDVLRMEIFSQMREYPILLCPVASIPAFRHGERSWNIDGQTVEYLDAWSYTEWFNLLGTPAAAIPFGRSKEGLPIGVQIVARPWEEELVLAVAAELEAQGGAWQTPA